MIKIVLLIMEKLKLWKLVREGIKMIFPNIQIDIKFNMNLKFCLNLSVYGLNSLHAKYISELNFASNYLDRSELY